MRAGLAFSITGHLAILAFGVVAFPDTETFKVDDIETFSVDLVPIAELTNLAAGDRKGEKTPDAAAQPKPVVKAEAPLPKPAEKPEKTPVKAAEPSVIVAALPKPPAPEPPAPTEAEPQAIAPEAAPLAPAQKPRTRPKPPAKPVKTTKKPDRPSFNPDEIAALLNKQESAGGGDPSPAETPQTFGVNAGSIDAAMTQSEQDAMIGALRNRLAQCWNPPRGVREAGSLRVTVGIALLPDGSLATDPKILDAGFDPLSRIAAESAIRAVQICAPYDMLPPEKYRAWREIEFVFDPREMLGG